MQYRVLLLAVTCWSGSCQKPSSPAVAENPSSGPTTSQPSGAEQTNATTITTSGAKAVLDFHSGRVSIWHLEGVRFAVVYPYALRLREPGERGRVDLGLVHSGYTRPDPDGRTALLSGTLCLAPMLPTPEELNVVSSRGASITIARFVRSELSLDVRLALDVGQEARIRDSLRLPRHLELGASVPFQIRFTGVEGVQLYQWLTDRSSALEFVASGSAAGVVGLESHHRSQALGGRDSDQLDVTVPVDLSCSPGAALVTGPNYVKDLSGQGSGLEALAAPLRK